MVAARDQFGTDVRRSRRGTAPCRGRAWSGLAEELASSMSSFSSVVAELTNGSWLGPSSAAMMAVATQYMAWLSAAATQAEQVAAQAAATATAFEAALAATVQPAVVAANRGLMQVLAATNWLGFNTPAIMDIEAAYEQMWAMDVVAMATYHADASAAASLLAPWQQVLRNLGIDIGKNGAINLGFGNTGSGNIGIGNTGSGNLGIGNTGSSNIGGGNTGNNNVGMGNLGNSNLGIGSTGNHDVGVGLTGNNKFGFGGLNSGSGNIGFGNSGTGNVGFFNSGNGNLGIGNSGLLNNGLGNSGNINTGFGNVGGMSAGLWPSVMQNNLPGSAGLDAGLANSASYATGGTATLSSSILSSALGQTGALHPGLANALNPAPATPPAATPITLLPESTPARTPATPMPAPAPGQCRTARRGQRVHQFLQLGQQRSRFAQHHCSRAGQRRSGPSRVGHPQVDLLPQPRTGRPRHRHQTAGSLGLAPTSIGSARRPVRTGAYPRLHGRQKGRPHSAGRRLGRLSIRLPDHRR
ncbi:PPE family protein [Mycobacterium kansasii]|uniref:PPE family protein n=1 Tax=Mycobacterium kansasii TaxID=1768 RepID=A0A1V3WQ84_MYCKA|nr:PPE family protein [Mycobacterium kansasii]